jgi:hypothetical protein
VQTIIHTPTTTREAVPDPRPTPPTFVPVDVTGWDPTEVADMLFMDDDAQDRYTEDLAAWEARQTGREAAEDVAAGDLAGLIEDTPWPDSEAGGDTRPAGPRTSVRTSPGLPWGDGTTSGVIAVGGITVAVVSLPYARDGAAWADGADQVLRAAGWARTGPWTVDGSTVHADVEQVRS